MISLSPLVSPERGVTLTPDHVILDGNTSRLLLTCVSEAMLEISFQWTFNGSVLLNEVSQTLILNETTPSENGGDYECIVSNAAGNGSATVTVLFSPVITTSPTDQTASDGSQNISFSCLVTGFPPPTIQWYRQGNTFLPETSFISNSGLTSTLTFGTVLFGDEGDYFCSASSLNMTATSDIAALYGKTINFA